MTFSVRYPGRGIFVHIVLLTMVLVGCASVPLTWDAHDPTLHGQKFRFTEPYVYYVLHPRKDRRDYDKESRKIGRVLTSRFLYLAGTHGDPTELAELGKIETVAEREVFTIQKSYRKGLSSSKLYFDLKNFRKLTVTSSLGVNATMPASALEDTDRNDLYQLLEKKQVLND